MKTAIPQLRSRVSTYGLLAFPLALVAVLLAPAPSLAAIGDLTYAGCIANFGANGCERPLHNSLGVADAVAVSPDDESVYVGAPHAITQLKRRSSGALMYRGCIANGGALGCQKADHASLYDVRDLAVSPDGKSVYAVAYSGNSITRFKRSSSGDLAYKGCFANRGAHGCKKARHKSLGGASGVAVSSDGKSVYVASRLANSVTALKRPADGALTYGDCFANQGARGCEAPVLNSLADAEGVAVSRDGRSVYVAASESLSITLFGRETFGP